ncbi:MAG: bifunctional diaminohydroxyphosphoribosylaminopyrimidine deaminase/5-amino-6-(5-phosphoribosylamino)uracil reductase RibD [Phycisphaerae bacterium]|nr:bifunctional diaminohydroxyphosphoribosylaminopyrimidine deaminase/5-amino-6-(5-phosphoribosylamino)uracil reductase RibD [Phycisphaerae bacterium]
MSASCITDDERWMARALRLAARGAGYVEPNPMVGCVLVRGGRLLAEGYHRRYGGPHAEMDALQRCTCSPKGATAYVTLEPCCHMGKTGPCTEALISAGIARVVVALRDPFPAVAGKGLRRLRRAGMRVDVGAGAADAARLAAPYLKLCRTGQPWVIAKWAQSLDGRIATRTGQSQWISGPSSRHFVHRLRGRVDAIVVGIGTVLADDPLLTCRARRPRRIPTRVVLDSHLRLPRNCRLWRTARQAPLLVVTTHDAIRRRHSLGQITAAGAEVLALRTKQGRTDVRLLLAELGRRRMTNVLVEGGAEVLGAFADHRAIDEAFVFVTPRIIGGRTAPAAIGGRGPSTLTELSALHDTVCRRIGTDWLFHARWAD